MAKFLLSKYRNNTLILICLLFTWVAKAQKYEELALSPPMGWSSWNKFDCRIDENLIREMADHIVSSGLKDAGYVYVNLDDCWHGERDSLGNITSNAERFPSGIKALADYIHAKGLKLGLYSDAGHKTCAGRPGSAGYEYQDALKYAQWGVDYLKYDWCYSDDINPKGAYALMRDALYKAGRPVLFSMCEWGASQPWTWAKDVGHLWRTTGDIELAFDSVREPKAWKSYSVRDIIELQVNLRQYAGPGHWNDPDMLEVGNGFSVNQDRAHFSLWCMMAAPLILGNDVRNMSRETKNILTNKEVIAIDQDLLGIQGMRVDVINEIEVWFKPLQNGDWAFCIFNRKKESQSFTIQWQKYNINDEVSGCSIDFYNTTYQIRNLWTKKTEGSTAKPQTVIVPGEDVVMYRLSKV